MALLRLVWVAGHSDLTQVMRGSPDLTRSVAIVRETRNEVRPMSGAQNEATAMAFGGPRSSCVRPGAHSARHQNSRNDWTPCRMAWPFVSAGAHAPHADETPDLRLCGGASHSARRLRSLAFLCSSKEEAGRPDASEPMDQPAIRFRHGDHRPCGMPDPGVGHFSSGYGHRPPTRRAF